MSTRSVHRSKWSWVLPTYLGIVLFYLFIPVLVVIAFSFNDVNRGFNVVWQGFTLEHWLDPFRFPDITESVITSLVIALIASALATILGTFIALALVRYRFKGRSSTNVFLFLPMATPEVVLGSALLALFISIGIAPGFGTVMIAHILFIVSYAVVTVRARIAGFDRHLEEAAMDLYSDEWNTFRRVTLPMIMPGVLAAFMLGFALSFDDFVITNFNSGTVQTWPMYVWSASRRGIPAQVNVFATAIFIITTLALFVNLRLQSRRARAKTAA
jgi:spermidine/putrescine transport system permease protein